MAGISINNCLMLTALDAMAAGYEVYVVVDASGTNSQLVELAAMMRLTQAGAVMTSWVTLASELMNDWQTPEGAKVGALYQKYSDWGGSEQTVRTGVAKTMQKMNDPACINSLPAIASILFDKAMVVLRFTSIFLLLVDPVQAQSFCKR